MVSKPRRIRLNTDDLRFIVLFETLTGARVKDCITVGDVMSFLVEKGDIKQAIGKGGSKVEKVKKVLNREIVVLESSDDEKRFIENLFQPVKLKGVRFTNSTNGRVAIVEVGKFDKNRVIGREGVRIKIAKEFAKRHWGIEDIKIKQIGY